MDAQQNRKRVLLAMDYYDYQVHKGVAKVARKNGWRLVCRQSSPYLPSVPEDWSGDGVITLICTEKTKTTLSKLSCPMVDLGLSDHGLSLHRVVTDNESISKLAARHFIERGFSTFVELDQNFDHMLNERKEGFRRAIDRVLPYAQWVQLKDLQPSEIEKHVKSHPFPWAYWGYSDGLALQFMDVTIHMGYDVPNDIAILGTDNNDLICESFELGLSSIDSDQEGLGIHAAQTLEQLMDGRSAPPLIERHPPKDIVVRASSDQYTSNHPKVQKALSLIDHHLGDGISAKELAELMDYTPQTLQRLFKEHYPFSPAEAIRRSRMDLAKTALTQTKWSLEKVAKICGYGSLDSMCRCFKRDANTSPGKLRKHAVQNSIL